MYYCSKCGNQRMDESRFCPHCDLKRQKNKIIFLSVFFSLLLTISTLGISYVLFYQSTSESEVFLTSSDLNPNRPNHLTKYEEAILPVAVRRELEDQQKRELTEIIADAQETVYTIFSDTSQGSGFLYNNEGAVVTNAHVVEGKINVLVKTVNGVEYPGRVIGYSNQTDIAVIDVPDLEGIEPFPIEKEESVRIGEEVIALGSPLGLENTATMGYVTGSNRNFIIDTYIYEDLYQISAPISPGSSGGPLLSKTSETIIAINSAQNIEERAIGFSIPIYKVHDIIESWILSPMNEEDILDQFYDAFGRYFFDEFHNDGYFDGGYFSEDDDFYHYYEYEYYEFWDEFGAEYWDYYMNDEDYDEEWFEARFHEFWEEYEGDDYYNENDRESWYDQFISEYEEWMDRWYYEN
ncbi:trypsin-like peptidase domain-containing protein [Evansella sp. AB-rgal1]|uniref:trypsin-like peptidase domain-containing protein n=1 Tax=Evansella sp. AB-rgal1 TaxID=3242696 RepID=UPI00359D621A